MADTNNSPKINTRPLVSKRLTQGLVIGSIFILAGVLGVLKIESSYTIAGYAFLDYEGDQIENGSDKRIPVLKVNVYSDEDASGDLSTGDYIIHSGVTDAEGAYSISFSTGNQIFSSHILNSSDDAEEEEDGDVSTSSSDLEMVYDGSKKQIVGIRFGNINIPDGATISSAYIRFRARQSSGSSNSLNIYGELSPNSLTFTGEDENISSRSKTSAVVNWTTGSWSSGSYYDSDNLKTVIDEIRNQADWTSLDPITFIIEGSSGTKNAYSGTTNGPELIINYSIPTPQNDFIVAIDTNHLVSGSTISQSHIPIGGASNVGVSYRGQGIVCYAVADNENQFAIINRVSGITITGSGGGSTGVGDIEAVAFDPSGSRLYAVDDDVLGIINLKSGVFTAKSNKIGRGNGAEGNKNISDIDGLSFDPFTGDLWATERNSNQDYLLKIDTATGLLVEDAFGTGVDYVLISGTGILDDVDDIAVSSEDGKMYGVNNGGGSAEYLIEIDKSTGNASILSSLSLNGENLEDVEGFGFTNFGLLLATTGNSEDDETSNSLYTMNLNTGAATLISAYGFGEDYEGCDCLTGASNLLEGYVYEDVDKDNVFDGAETPLQNVKLRIYTDEDASGDLSAGDILVDSINSNSAGFYSWTSSSNLDFIVEIDTASLPFNYARTSTGEHEALFAGSFGGLTDSGNNFGAADKSTFPVEWSYFTGQWKDDSYVLLNWATRIEINTSSFEIERSIDGLLFEAIGSVPAAGESTELRSYDYEDQKLSIRKDQKLYYRLRQIDIDGKFSFSTVIELSALDEPIKLDFKLFPNPATDKVKFELIGDYQEVNVLTVIDQKGNQKQKWNLSTLKEEEIDIEIAQWPKGIYNFILESEEDKIVKQLIVQ